MTSTAKPTVRPDLAPFLNPAGIVLVGASSDPSKLGYALAANLVRSGYDGAIHFVNPKGGTLFGRPVRGGLDEVPDPVDLAVLLVPAPAAPAALAACGERGIRAAVLASGGFRETGPEGAALEEACLAAARACDVRLVGPNCIGLIDTHLPFDTTFLPPPGPPRGDVAFLSHSGALCAAVIDQARSEGFGFSRLVSLGNQADVTETDLLSPVAADPQTRVVALYLEGLRDGRRFVEMAAEVVRRTPVVALKVGRSAGGRRAAASHTGALAGSENAYDAAFRRAGVLRAPTSAALFDWARALAWCPLPAGPRMAVLTNAGGPGVAAADALESRGLTVAPLSSSTREALQEHLPAAASTADPVDMLASATPEQYAACLRVLLDAEEVDGVLLVLPPMPVSSAGAVARAVLPAIEAHAKPVVAAVLGGPMTAEAVAHFRAAKVPDYRFPEPAAEALAVLHCRAEHLRRTHEDPVAFAGADQALAREIAAAHGPAAGLLRPDRAAALLGAWGIPVAPLAFAATPDEAVRLADEAGYPVALKRADPSLVHKSEAGGVRLGLRDADAVAGAFEAVAGDALGVYVQPMAAGGQDVIVGALRDDVFGPLVMFGSGGVEVEGLGDVAFALAPLTPSDADHLLASTWAGRRLGGFRHLPPGDRAAVRDVLFRLAHLAEACPRIAEIEINPLRVFASGVLALDPRVILAEG